MPNGHAAQIAAARRSIQSLFSQIAAPRGPRGCTLFLYLKYGRDVRRRWQRMRFDAQLEREVRSNVLEQLAADIDDRELEVFAFDEMISGHIGAWRKETIPELAGWFDAVPVARDWPHVFTNDEEHISTAKFYVTAIPVAGADRPLIAFRQRSKNSLVGRGLWAIFDTVAHQFHPAAGKVFQFDHKIDFFEWDGTIYVLNQAPFESITNIRTATQEKARESLDAIALIENVHIDRFNEIVAGVVQRPLLAKKIASAHYQGILEEITGPGLAARIGAKHLPIRFDQHGDQYRFFPDPTDSNQMREFVRLLTDYYLSSPLTQIEYRALAKRRD